LAGVVERDKALVANGNPPMGISAQRSRRAEIGPYCPALL
jgi:hypothetical protein